MRRAGANFLAGALPGAAVGGIAGVLSADDFETGLRRGLGGAALGATLGGGANVALQHFNKQFVPASTHFGPETPDPIRKTHTSSGAPIYGPRESRGTAPYHPPDIPPPPPDLRAYQPPPPQRTGPISPDAAQMRADMGLEVTGSLNYQGIRPMKKLAFVGPMVEAEAMGLPSMLGYFAGRLQPMTEELAKKEIERDYDTMAGFVLPGYTGYHFGLRHGAGVHLRDLEKERAKAIQDHAVKTAMAHYGLAKSSFLVGPNAASTARRVNAAQYGLIGGTIGAGVGAIRGAYNAPKGERFSGALKGGLKGGAIGTAAGAGLGALRGHTMDPGNQAILHEAMPSIQADYGY